MTNLMMTIPIGPIQPHVAGGIGLIRSHATYNPLQIATSKSAFGRDFGGGLTIMFGRAGLRGDLRHFHASDSVTFLVFNPEKLDFWRASSGITFKYCAPLYVVSGFSRTRGPLKADTTYALR